jgi:hypothetical protein
VTHGLPFALDQSIRPGKGLLVAALLLFIVEVALHSDDTLHRLRSVFAAGRTLDTLLYVKAQIPRLLIVGNSRADNGFDPRIVARSMGGNRPIDAFNLGIPGGDARVLLGLLLDLDRAGLLGEGGVDAVVFSLDEAILQTVDTLGQEVFFAERRTMLQDGQVHDVLRSLIRLYGFSDNLRQLREPGTLERFVTALKTDTDPIGGGAAVHAGYRAGFGAAQDRDAALRQEAGSGKPPSESNLRNFWRAVDLLESRGVRVAVVFPPLLNRNVRYLVTDSRDAVPYNNVMESLSKRSIPVIVLDSAVPRNPAEFVNAGHLSDQGAQRYSRLLGEELSRIWPPKGSRQ